MSYTLFYDNRVRARYSNENRNKYGEKTPSKITFFRYPDMYR